MLSKQTRKIILTSLLASGFLFANTIGAKPPKPGKGPSKSQIINSLNKRKPTLGPNKRTGNPGIVSVQQENVQDNPAAEDILNAINPSIVNQTAADENLAKKREQAAKEIAELDNRIMQLNSDYDKAETGYKELEHSESDKASLKEEKMAKQELRMIQIKSEIKGCEMRKTELQKIVNDKVAVARRSILHHFSNGLIERDITSQLSEL